MLLWLARVFALLPRERTPRAPPGSSRTSSGDEDGAFDALPEVDLSQPSPEYDWGETEALGEDRKWRFGFTSCQVPTPVAFPRDELEGAVREHEELVRAHLPAIEFVVRRSVDLPAKFNLMDTWCVQLFPRGSAPPLIHCCERTSAAHGYRRLFGLARQLVKTPQPYEGMYLLVHARDVVSLSVLRLRREPLASGGERCELEVDRPSVVVEPLQQHSVREGDEWVVAQLVRSFR
jgi:hypothetical protein